jgi:hypothetical protein
MRFFFLFFIALLIAISKSSEVEETAGRIIEEIESDKFQNDEIINVETASLEAEAEEIEEIASQVS